MPKHIDIVLKYTNKEYNDIEKIAKENKMEPAEFLKEIFHQLFHTMLMTPDDDEETGYIV